MRGLSLLVWFVTRSHSPPGTILSPNKAPRLRGFVVSGATNPPLTLDPAQRVRLV